MAERERGISQPLLLVSDLDDTIKISNVQSKMIMTYRGLFRSSAFAGMAPLYQEILGNHPGSQFKIISSSPPPIRRKIENFLTINGFPKADIMLRDWIRYPSVSRYKIDALRDLAASTPLPLLLIGDDTQHDPEVFAGVDREFPGKVIARYIRIVKGRELPEGSQGFFTAFDIACAELAEERLSNEQVLRVGEAVLKAEKTPRLIPWFSLMPPLHFVPFLVRPDQAIVDLWEKIKAKVESIPRRKR